MGLTQLHMVTIYSAAFALVLSLTVTSADEFVLQKTPENGFNAGEFPEDDRVSKRPFCNTFTGCGRKRDEIFKKNHVNELNPEPGLEELSRRILSEAKLWEAEMERQRDPERNLIPRNLPLALAMTNFRRKRATTAFDQQSGVRIEEKSKR